MPSELIMLDPKELKDLHDEVSAKLWKPNTEFKTGVAVPMEIDARIVLGLIHAAMGTFS